jgi:hypothetical protein
VCIGVRATPASRSVAIANGLPRCARRSPFMQMTVASDAEVHAGHTRSLKLTKPGLALAEMEGLTSYVQRTSKVHDPHRPWIALDGWVRRAAACRSNNSPTACRSAGVNLILRGATPQPSAGSQLFPKRTTGNPAPNGLRRCCKIAVTKARSRELQLTPSNVPVWLGSPFPSGSRDGS